MSLLKMDIINLTKKYHNRFVYHDFCYYLDNKTINFLKSPNGSGKSTLIKCILNLISYKGMIETNISTFAYMPERIIVPEFIKVYKFLELLNIDMNKAKQLLREFKVNENKYIYELSKGMRQKILLVQALSTISEGYIFDEPLNGLDDDSIEVFKRSVYSLYEENKFILISTHQLEKFDFDNMKVIKLGDLIVTS